MGRLIHNHQFTIYHSPLETPSPPFSANFCLLNVTLNLDHKQMGVGGDNSWGAQTHPEYTLPARSYSYRFRLRPFSADDPPPVALSKQKFAEKGGEGVSNCQW